MTAKEIKAHYKELHDTLSKAYYDGSSGLSKEEFDLQHAQVWTDMEAELVAGGYLIQPGPSELEKLKGRVKALEDKQKSPA